MRAGCQPGQPKGFCAGNFADAGFAVICTVQLPATRIRNPAPRIDTRRAANPGTWAALTGLPSSRIPGRPRDSRPSGPYTVRWAGWVSPSPVDVSTPGRLARLAGLHLGAVRLTVTPALHRGGSPAAAGAARHRHEGAGSDPGGAQGRRSPVSTSYTALTGVLHDETGLRLRERQSLYTSDQAHDPLGPCSGYGTSCMAQSLLLSRVSHQQSGATPAYSASVRSIARKACRFHPWQCAACWAICADFR